MCKVLFLAAISVWPAVAFAQSSNGTIAGTVTDPKDAVVPRADVRVVSPEFGSVHQTRADSIGTFRLESLQPGTYTVTISSSGFADLAITNVVVNGSLTTTLNAKLQLAVTQQTVEIVAPAAQIIDTQSGEMGGTLNQQELVQLPFYSLNPAELALTLPGVHDVPSGQGAVNANFTNGFGFSVNGTRPRANNFLIDGQDDNDYTLAGQALQPTNLGAIEEVTILTNAYSAEFGRGGGSVTNYIYKSGTNLIHGDLWEINRNSALAAIPAQTSVAGPATKNPYDNENTFGFDAGGPILKDKLFVFGAAQWDRERQAATSPVFNLPTATGIQTLQTNFSTNANVNLFLKAIGSAVSPGLNGVTGIDSTGNAACSANSPYPCVQMGDYQINNINTASNAYDWNYRMDYQFTDRDMLTGSIIRDNYSLSPDTFNNPSALPGFQTQQSGPSAIYRGQWVHTFSPSYVNELRMSYTSIDFKFDLPPATAANPLANIPFISFGGDAGFPSIGVDSGYPNGRAHHTWQVQDKLEHTISNHTIKAGVDLTILHADDTVALNTRGSITYNEGGGYSSLANFILDQTGRNPGSLSKGFGNPNVNASANMVAPYIEDVWRVKNNLTVTLGLRYEYWGALANALAFPSFNVGLGFGLPTITDSAYTTDLTKYESLFSNKQIPDKTNFAPRIGLAYTPHWGKLFFGDGKTTFRSGYGIFYDGLFTNITINTAAYQPNTVGGSILSQTGTGTANASTFPGISATTFNSSLALFTMASNLHNPMTQQWNVEAQRELPLRLILTLAYVGTRGTHLFANQEFNPEVNYAPMNSNFGTIAVRTNAGDSVYNSGQIEVERKMRSLFLRAAYTYSKFFDDVSEISTTTGTSNFSQILTNQRSDWGPSAFDQRHRLTIAYGWQLPYFHRNSFLRILTDQWEWSGIATFESGTPNTVSIGFDNIGNGHPNSRPDLANPSAPLTSVGVDGGDYGGVYLSGVYYDFFCVNSGSQTCPMEAKSTFHFVVPNTVPGDVGRNSLFGPGQVYFDTAIARDFPIHIWKLEHHVLQFRTDFFNAFNHPNLFTPSYNFISNYYDNTAITINGGRQIKLWLKYSF